MGVWGHDYEIADLKQIISKGSFVFFSKFCNELFWDNF